MRKMETFARPGSGGENLQHDTFTPRVELRNREAKQTMRGVGGGEFSSPIKTLISTRIFFTLPRTMRATISASAKRERKKNASLAAPVKSETARRHRRA